MKESIKTYYKLKTIQIKDQYLLSKKQLEDEKITEINIKYELENWFEKVLTTIQNKLDEDYNPLVYLFQVEEIVNDNKQDYLDILAENIQDFYIRYSEIVEAKTNNKISQKMLDNSLLIDAANKRQTSLDEFYEYGAEDALSEEIKKKLRFNNNIQHSLDSYLTYDLQLIGFTPSELTRDELLQYEIDQAVIEYMTENIFIASESTLTRVTQKIYDIIKESYANQGHGINKVTEDIQNKFTDLKTFEAERIARTETLKAQGHATYKRLVNNPNVEYFQWISTHDRRTRRSHVKIDGEITFADGSGMFSNGLRFPGDTLGAIEEWINCRCTLVAYIPDVGMVAPSGVTCWRENEMVFDKNLDIPDVNVELDEYLASWW